MALPAGLTIKQILAIEGAFKTQPPEWREKLEATLTRFLGPGPTWSNPFVYLMVERTVVFHDGYWPEGDLRGDIVEFPFEASGTVAADINQNLAITAQFGGAGKIRSVDAR
jgi:hypothetical protein